MVRLTAEKSLSEVITPAVELGLASVTPTCQVKTATLFNHYFQGIADAA